MFPDTRWTLILASRQGGEARRHALETLMGAYWRPLYVFARRKGLSSEAAEDAVQGFFLKLLEHDFPDRLDPTRGRLRSYLLTGLERYLVTLHERDTAQKRGGDARMLSLDVLSAERDLPGAPDAAVAAFEREWALLTMERALARLGQEYADGRRQGPAAPFLRFFGRDEAPPYSEAAAQADLTVPQFKAALHRARARYRELLREEVCGTLGSEAQPDEEIAALLRALGA
jgi:DNA-directed RNA polymerase specialized sigma24 family protein